MAPQFRFIKLHKLFQRQQQIYNRMAEKENKSVAMMQSPDLNLIKMLQWDLKRAVQKQMLQTSMNTLILKQVDQTFLTML